MITYTYEHVKTRFGENEDLLRLVTVAVSFNGYELDTSNSCMTNEFRTILIDVWKVIEDAWKHHFLTVSELAFYLVKAISKITQRVALVTVTMHNPTMSVSVTP